ncbi:MAG TPA: ATP-binding cassette domain-containing protein [Rubricoccaceae bacterium]|nr:ATP-binding cassette domain-containing protein [Rubricoccaceae bacterium]
MPLLEVEHVTKRYGQGRTAVVAVDDVSFRAEPGRIFGLLGPNGAGKTSTIRMIAYITTPDAGRITLGGRPVGPATQRLMGYLPEERGLYRKLRVGEQLVYLARLKGRSASEAEAAARRWLDRFDALGWWSKRVEELSKGMQQKVQFIATVAHDPALVILDEPFTGLDPLNTDLLREVIAELRAAGRTVLFASHRMEQVEQVCDDLCLIAEGRVVLSGALREVKRRFGRDTVTLAFDGGDGWLDALAAGGAVEVLSRTAGHVTARLADGTPPRRVLEAALAGAREVVHFELHEPPLDEIFRIAVSGDRAAGPSDHRAGGGPGGALPPGQAPRSSGGPIVR